MPISSRFRRISGTTACIPALLLALLAGCASAPPLPKLQADVPAGWRNAPADQAKLGPAPDLTGWWRAFGDAELDRLVERALADNLSLREAGYRIAAARMLADRSGREFLPRLDFRTYEQPNPQNTASYFQAGFDAQWELGLFGRGKSSARTAAGELGVAEADAQSARVSVVAEVVRAYIELRAAQQRRTLLDGIVADDEKALALTRVRERYRLAAPADVDRTEATLAAAQAVAGEPRLTVERCRQQLGVLLGTGTSDPVLDKTATPPTIGELRIASAPADLLRARPEIRRAEATVLKAAGELGLARADLYPHLVLGSSLSFAALVTGNTRLGDVNRTLSIGPIIDLPLFDWGARLAAANARNAELSAALAAYRQAVLAGVAEAETALATLEESRERVAHLGSATAALERSAAATATLHRLGLADGIDRAGAQVAALDAQAELNRAREAHAIAFVALYKALGGAPLPAAELVPVAAAQRTDAPPPAAR